MMTANPKYREDKGIGMDKGETSRLEIRKDGVHMQKNTGSSRG